MANMHPPHHPQDSQGWSLTTQIVTGLAGGIFLGLFLGEYTRHLKFLGDVYIGLMQMTVLPYIVFSLIGNIGSLSLPELRLLSRSALLIYLLIWGLSAFTVLMIVSAFPTMLTGQLFSSALIDPPPELDLYNLFIPSNPFRSLVDNAVPAVVVFCILLGVALIDFKEKRSLLDPIGIITDALHRVNGMVVRLTPIGVFGIAADAAGTMTLAEVERLQGYYLAFGAAIVLMTFVALPLLVTLCTPFRYREVMHAARNALLTAFVTGSVISVIPLLIDGVKSLYADQSRISKEAADFPEFILPLVYPFPNAGNVATLVFIPFAAWFVGQNLSLGENLSMFGMAFFLLFGKVFLTIPFLLNNFRIPQDMFQLFIAAGVVASRWGDVLGSMHYMVLTILATAAMTGQLKIHWVKLSRILLLYAVLLISSMTAVNLLMQHLNKTEASQQNPLAQLQLLTPNDRPSTIVSPSPNPAQLSPGQNRLDRIMQRGILRIGYLPDNLPYSFTNTDGALVGYDIDLVNSLARELNVALEFVPYERITLVDQLNHDHFDIAISGMTVTLDRTSIMLMTDPYLIVNMGLVVRDHLREEYASEAQIARIRGLRLAVTQGSYYEQIARERFPDASIIPLASARDFFTTDLKPPLDALVTHAESGAAWTLVYPDYCVVNPFDHHISAQVSMIVSGFDMVLGDTLNTWIKLQIMDGATDRLFEHWMQGKSLNQQQPRWSILQNVLHAVP